MRFTAFWLRRAVRRTGHSYFSVLKSAVLRYLEHKTPQPVGFKPRFKVFAKLNLMLWTLPFRLKRAPEKSVLMLNIVPSAFDQRYYFLKRYMPGAPAAEGVAAYAPYDYNDKLIHNGIGFRCILRLFHAAWLIWWGGFFDLFSKGKTLCIWHISASQLLLQQILFHGEDRKIVVFFCFYPQSYLSAYVASALDPSYHPVIISSNSILFENNRYLYHPGADMRLCSRVLLPEADCYIRFGWMALRSVELWGLEEVEKLDKVPVTAPSIDIGLYSSGFWARTENGWRIAEPERIRSGEFLGNRWFKIFEGMLDVAAQLKREHPDLKVKVYLHPFERRLYRDYGIEPPFLGMARANGFELELEGQDSINQFYEARIGLSSQSTIVFDRLHYGLESYFYSGKERWQPIYVEYLGEYARYGFPNMEDLRAKLLASIKV